MLKMWQHHAICSLMLINISETSKMELDMILLIDISETADILFFALQFCFRFNGMQEVSQLSIIVRVLLVISLVSQFAG